MSVLKDYFASVRELNTILQFGILGCYTVISQLENELQLGHTFIKNNTNLFWEERDRNFTFCL